MSLSVKVLNYLRIVLEMQFKGSFKYNVTIWFPLSNRLVCQEQ